MPTESPAAITDAVTRAIEAHRERPGALLPILHQVQDDLGYVPASAVAGIAEALNLSRAEVHGVISFYHDFRETPAGRHVVKICRAESCQAVGGDQLIEHACRALGVEFHGTTIDGAITLEPVYCLGNCALSPALQVGNEVHGRMTPKSFDRLVADLRKSR
jgi:formate dehydrogenase subunit gamma